MSDSKTRIAWLTGSYHARRSMMAKIREKFSSHEVIQSDSSCTFEYLMSLLQSVECFSEKRLVIINEMPEFKDSNKKKYIDKFKEVLEVLDEDIFVVFNGISCTKEKSLFALAEKIGKIYDYPEVIERKAAPQWTLSFLKKMGYSLDIATANALVDNCGFDSSLDGIGADMMEMAMYRLAMCLPANKKEISLEDVELSVFEHQNFIVWDLLNAMDDQDYDRCINMMHKVKILDSNAIYAVTSVMNTLLWKFRLLMYLKERLSIDKDTVRAGQSALQMRKLKRQGVGESAKMTVEIAKTGQSAGQASPSWNNFSIQQALEGMYGKKPLVSLYSRRDMYRIMRAIQHAVTYLRTANSEGEAFLLADIVFMTACKTADDKDLKQIMQSFERSDL